MSAYRSVSVRFAIVAMVAAGFSAPAVNAEELCSVLAKVNAAGATGFSSIQGPSQPGDRWQSKVLVPEFAACQLVLVNGSKTLMCYSSKMASATEAAAKSADLAARIAKCSTAPAEVAHNDIGQTTMDMVLSLDMPVGYGLSTTQNVYDAETGTFSDGWMVQLMGVGNDASTDGTEGSEPAEVPAPTSREESSKPAKFELKAENLCSTIKKIVDAGLQSADFKSIQGAAVDGETWRTTLRPEGAFDCDLNRSSSGKYYYTCKLLETSSADAARVAFDQVNGALASCLGSSWVAEKTTQRKDVEMDYTNDDNDFHVELKLGSLLRDWTLRFYVRAY